MRNVAIILASGTGSRFGGKVPKQFLKCNGKMLVEYSVDVFSSFVEIEKILIVVHKSYIVKMQRQFQANVKVEVIEGGSQRCESSRKAIEHLAGAGVGNVLIHDAARPLISTEIVKKCLDELQNSLAVVVAVASQQTVSVVNNGKIVQIPQRDTVFVHQTPQCFDYRLILNAFNEVDTLFTDDVSVVFGKCDVAIVQGSYDNIKITNSQDISTMKEILRKKP